MRTLHDNRSPRFARRAFAGGTSTHGAFASGAFVTRGLAVCLLVAAAVAVRAADRYAAPGGELLITPFMHSSVQVELGSYVLQVDPWSAGDLSAAKPADLILVTDDVGHHLDVKAIARLRKPGAPVVIAANGRAQVPDGVVMANGDTRAFGSVSVEAIAAYDLKPGAPEHPKGEANGYVVTMGGARLLFAGVTECVPEVKRLRNIDVAFVPMNIPVERMSPRDASDCVKAFKPKVVYPYHYDQDYAARVTNPRAAQPGLPDGITVAQSLALFRRWLDDTGIEVRLGPWYPAR